VRTIPVLGPVPAIFGMAAASYILCQLAGAPFEGEPIIQLTGLQYDRALDRLITREEERYGTDEGVAVDKDDVSMEGWVLVRALKEGACQDCKGWCCRM
jgi:hypothetical protein